MHTTIRGTNVTVQALSTSGQQTSASQLPLPTAVRRVVVSSATGPVVPPSDMIDKVLLKCVSKDKKSESKIFSLRNINVSLVTTCDRLRGLIKAQLGDELRDVFDVGYYHNNIQL